MDSEENAPVCVRVEVHNFDVLCWRCFSVAPCRSHSHRAEAVLQWVWGSLVWFWRSQGLQASGKGLMGFLQAGYELPETVLRMGKRRGFHPRVQGQSLREKKWKKSSDQLQTDTHLLSPCPEGPDKLVSLWQALLHTSQLRTHWRHLSELEALIQLQALGSSGRWTTGALIKVRDIPILQRNQFSLIILLFFLVLLVAIDLGSSKRT